MYEARAKNILKQVFDGITSSLEFRNCMICEYEKLLSVQNRFQV